MQPYQARLFIALPIPNIHRPKLSAWADHLKELWSFKRWIHPADYHITLKFLGEADFATTIKIKEYLRTLVQTQSPFRLYLEGLGTFENSQSTKILWTGVKGDLSELNQLQENIELEMEKLLFPKEKNPYRPHVSLARNYMNGKISNSELQKAPMVKPELLVWEVNQFILYQTHLGKSPSYQPLAVYPFKQK